MLIRTEAIVLRSIPFSETSLISTLFTKEKGKMSVMAKGARRPKSRFGSTLQPLSVVQAVIYYRPTRSLQTISECAHTRIPLLDSLECLTAGLRMAELTYALTQEEEELPTIFDLLVSVLCRMRQPHSSAALLQLYFEMQLATELGFAPGFEREAVRTLPSTGGLLQYENGEIIHEGAEGPHAKRASRIALRTFAILSRAQLDVVADLPPPPIHEVQYLVSQYMRYHVAEAYPERGHRILKQIQDN